MGLLYLYSFAFCWERCPLRPLGSSLYILSPLQASKLRRTVAGFTLISRMEKVSAEACQSRWLVVKVKRHPTSWGGVNSSEQGGLVPFPKGLEGHSNLMSFVWAQGT